MVYSYFPGCTLKNKAVDLDRWGRASAKALGIELVELPEWQCCGGVYPMSKDEVATKLSSVRALKSAKEEGHDLVTLCSACHNVIKQVNNDMRTDENIASHVNNYLGKDEAYDGSTNVYHLLEVIRDQVGFEEVKKRVVNPLTGKKIGAYYGCLLLRPSNVMQLDNPENPTIIEDLIKALGATPVTYAQRNECCGGYLTMEDKSIPKKRSEAILTDAENSGAEVLVTACPLCRYNLVKNSVSDNVKVVYFTELLAEALGVKD